MKIGNIELKHGLMLAPMAGFSDRAMRLVCHGFGAEYSISEMISAKAVTYGDKKTFALAKSKEDEGLVALQLFGSEPDVMARATEIIINSRSEEIRPCAIDINMGCPVAKIYNNGEGSALMKSPALIEKIVRSINNVSPLPVTVKLRLGIDREHINALECALAAEEGGAAAIALHGRTKSEMYSGEADREIIKNVKSNLHIPLIANGDIKTADDAVSMLEYTHADGIMIGRGAIGNPFIFEEITARLEGGDYSPPTLEARIDTALRQLRFAIEDKGERIAIPESRKQTALYLHGFRGAASVRAKINQATSYREVELALNELL